MKSSSAETSLDAMQEEFLHLNEHQISSLVTAQYGNKFLPGKRVFKIKRNEHEIVEKYTARFVAKRFAQTECVDFGETFDLTSWVKRLG